MSRRVQVALAAFSLLALWLVFFAWPPVRPFAIFEPPQASATYSPAATAHELEQPAVAAETVVAEIPDATVPRSASQLERVEVNVASREQQAFVHVHGRVTRRGRPVPDYDLLFHIAGAGLDDWEEWDFTDDDGAFEVFLKPGGYLVRNDDDGPWLTNVEVGREEKEHLLNIELPSGVVRGRVTRADTGAVVANATVHGLRSVEGHGSSDAIMQGLMARGGETNTGADGSFELIDLRPGDYQFVAEHESLLTAPVHAVVTDAPLEELVLSFRPGQALKGVVRGPGGEPVAMELMIFPGTRVVSLTQLEMSGVHYSNYDGEFTIEGLQPGPYVLIGRGETRTHDLGLRATLDFRPDAGPIELRAQRCGFLVITILRPDGTPATGAHVDLRAHDGGIVLGSVEWLEGGPVSDAEGRIELDDVLPGWYRVTPGSGIRLGQPLPAEVRAEETTRLELVLD